MLGQTLTIKVGFNLTPIKTVSKPLDFKVWSKSGAE